ncbi:hypothetical protein PGSY75_1104300 [Plasmodium gaboni]|uniref:FCH domain-containing protein n=1 Tax=Plasmodium gaboni TaxID=647221 RepID=A0A151LIH2_9APIC|nr:hypothetical protein PGSY75_1104300 [Plasmodium gaboni]KYN98687.1 hypothetical protein PGSY75_1104300 [Plasmodium gaboni]
MACSEKRDDVGSLENIKQNDKNEENLRNFESTFIYDWKKALKRVEEGRNCCENLSKIFSEMIRIEKEYENNLKNLCNMFQVFDNESSGINNGIISLRKNIERRCEQIKDFINYMECEILNNTLNSTLINHKNVFDQIKVDGIENEKIVERTRKESVKNIENCVYAYENLIDCINIFHNSRYFHPLKRIELSTSCINKYLFAKKKEYEYKNTINNINSVELNKEKRLKSILYSLESMDHKRISCVKDNIMKYLIFFTSYIRNIQYDINSCIDVFKDINAYKEIEEYCASHSNINRKKENEDLIFYNNIVSWPMLIDYFNDLYNINKKHLNQNIPLNDEMQVNYANHNKKGYTNFISSFFNVNMYKNLIQNNNIKNSHNFNNIYTNIFNEIVFFNKKEDEKEDEEEEEDEEDDEDGDDEDDEDGDDEDDEDDDEDVINDEVVDDEIEDEYVINDEVVDDEIEDEDGVDEDVINDKVADDGNAIEEKKNIVNLNEDDHKKENDKNVIDISRRVDFFENDDNVNIKDSDNIKKGEEKDLVYSKNKEQGTDNFDKENKSKKQNNKHNHQNNNNNNEKLFISSEKSESDIESDYSYKYIKNIYEKFECITENSGDTNENGCVVVSANINNNVKRMKIFFRYYIKNLFFGNFDKISDFNITSHFNIYRNRFLFCECLIDFIKKKRVFFVNVKSIVIFAKIILILLDYCNLHLDYWSCIYILVASENFFCELEVDDINMLLSKYPFNEKVKETNQKKKKKILNNNIMYNVNGNIKKNINIHKMNENNSIKKDIIMYDECKKNNKKKDTFSSSSFLICDSSENLKNNKMDHQIDMENLEDDNKEVSRDNSKSIVNIYECNKNGSKELNDTVSMCINNNLEENEDIETDHNKVNNKQNEEEVNETNYSSHLNNNNNNNNNFVEKDENISSKKKKILLGKFLYTHNIWNNIKFWEVSILIIISEIIQEMVLLEKLRYENKELLIKNYFFFFKYFNFYNSMINFGLSICQIELLLNKIFHSFNLKNDPVSRKFFFQVIDIATNKNITLNYIKMDNKNINNEYKKYYLQYYNNFLNDDNNKNNVKKK